MKFINANKLYRKSGAWAPSIFCRCGKYYGALAGLTSGCLGLSPDLPNGRSSHTDSPGLGSRLADGPPGLASIPILQCHLFLNLPPQAKWLPG